MHLQNSNIGPGTGPAEGPATTSHAAASKPTPAAGVADLKVEDEDAAWRARLAEELSGDEGDWAGLAGTGWEQAESATAPTATASEAPARHHSTTTRHASQATLGGVPAEVDGDEDAEDDDAWADRLWQDMQGALPLQKATYESNWAALEQWPAGKPIRFNDMPWPAPRPSSRSRQQQQPTAGLLQLDSAQLRTLILSGAQGPQDVKLALRRELIRWHPDKFVARWGGRLASADKEAILEGVHAVAQHLTALKQHSR
eukprot:gene14284-11_t